MHVPLDASPAARLAPAHETTKFKDEKGSVFLLAAVIPYSSGA